MMGTKADIPIRKKYTARRNTARPVHGSRDKKTRAVFLALSGIPIRPEPCSSRFLVFQLGRYTARTAVHTGFVSALLFYGLFCAVIAPAHTLSPTPTLTRARSTRAVLRLYGPWPCFSAWRHS
jgi:hypothetical protein